MNRKRMLIMASLATAAFLALPGGASQAGVRIGLHIGIPFFFPAPIPRVYVAPPPPVYYVQPAPVYVQPVPVAQPVYQVPAAPPVPAAPQVSQYYYLPAQPVPIR